MKIMTTILKAPLFHFFILGALLFVAYAWLNPESTDRNDQIIISEGQVKHISERFAKQWNRAPSDMELKNLIDDHVMTEIYYREGIKLGLDQNDPIIKKRIRKKTEMISKDLISVLDVKDETLQKYLDAHPEKFTIDAIYTFDQIYIDPAKHKAELTMHLAKVKKELLETDSAQTDSIMMPRYYSDMSTSRIDAEFGANFSAQFVTLKVGEWSEALDSGLGIHFVKLIKHIPQKVSNLTEVRDTVLREYLNTKRKEMLEMQRKEMRKNYEVVIDMNSNIIQKDKAQ